MNTTPSVVVIGGGISGLTAAWWLHKASVNVTVLEKEKHTGGTMITLDRNGWLTERGPNSALETTPLFRHMFGELGILDEMVYANAAGDNRFVLRNGLLHAIPMTPTAFLKTKLWNVSAKLRLLQEPFIGRAAEEETVAEFVERRLGREFLDYAINPFVAGVYAGDPAQLSVRAAFPKLYALEEKYGGLLKGQVLGARERKQRKEKAKDRAKMFSFKHGMQTFPDAIRKKLGKRILTGVFVEGIASKKSGKNVRYAVTGVQNKRQLTMVCDAVVTAVPAYIASDIIAHLDGSLSGSLKKIFYPPVVEVCLGYKRSDIGRELNGFGFLIPSVERRNILGTIWSSALFPDRSPKGYELLTTFIGGSRQPELTLEKDGRLVDIVTEELGDIMNVFGAPAYTMISRWPKAIPQYNLGHLSTVEDITKFERQHPGLFLGGNYRGGISVGDCVMSSERLARQVQEYLDTKMNLR